MNENDSKPKKDSFMSTYARCRLDAYGNKALAKAAQAIIDAVFDFDDDDEDGLSAPRPRTPTYDIRERPIASTYFTVDLEEPFPYVWMVTLTELSVRLPELRFVLRYVDPDSREEAIHTYQYGRKQYGSSGHGVPDGPEPSRPATAKEEESIHAGACSSRLFEVAKSRFARSCSNAFADVDSCQEVSWSRTFFERDNFQKYEVIKTLMTPEDLARCFEMEQAHKQWANLTAAVRDACEKVGDALRHVERPEVLEILESRFAYPLTFLRARISGLNVFVHGPDVAC